MAIPRETFVPAMPNYSEVDHDVWAALIERQTPLAAEHACRLFHETWPKLALDPKRLPDPHVVSERLDRLTGWTLADAQNEYLQPMDWFTHLAHFRFPVTNYIRGPHELDFTPLPDLFHEYFGHLAFFCDQGFADTSQMFGRVFLHADERQHLEIARLWWFSVEFGLIREDGHIRIIGAGLLSSNGEMLHALKPEVPKYDFDIRRVANTTSAPYGYHEAYWVMDGLEHWRWIIQEYARMEGLPVPQPPQH